MRRYIVGTMVLASLFAFTAQAEEPKRLRHQRTCGLDRTGRELLGSADPDARKLLPLGSRRVHAEGLL